MRRPFLLLLLLAVPADSLAPAPALRRLHSSQRRAAQPLLSAAAGPLGSCGADQPRARLRWPSIRLPGLGWPAGRGPALPGPAAAGLRRQGPVRWLLARVARIAVLASLLLSLGGVPVAGRLHTPAVAAPGAVTVERVMDSRRVTAERSVVHQLRRVATEALPQPTAGVVAQDMQPSAVGSVDGGRRSSGGSSGQSATRPTRPAASLRALASAAPAVRARSPPAASPTSVQTGAATRSRIQRAAAAAGETLAELQGHVSKDERDAMVLLATAALVAPIMGYLKLSPVLGFLAAGILLGPTGLGVVADVATTTKLAELGVVFFLFEMGERRFSVMEDFCFGSGCFEEVPTLLLLLAVLFWPLCSALRRHPLGVRRFVFGLIQFCPPHR